MHPNRSTNRWFAERYNVNNAWNFNGNNRNLNNNNVNNTNQVGAVSNLPKTRKYTYAIMLTEEQIFSLLLDTMRETRRNKRYGRDSSDFERNWAPLLMRMMQQLKEKTFRVDHNYAFLTSVPKWREIFATSFEGRIADHLLCDILAPYIQQELHPRTFNNRKGMGSQSAINRVIDDICEVSEGHTKPCRVIKWDLKGFFPNAWCDEIERQFVGVINRHENDIVRRYGGTMPDFLRWLTMVCIHCCPAKHCELRTPKHFWSENITPEKSLFGKPDGIGTPIGRLTSQMGMGLYLNDEVRWLNDECLIRSVLFMDDCVMVVPEENHAYALGLLPVLRERLAKKGVCMNEKKFYDQPYQRGLEFLGSHIKPYRIHINNKTYERALRRVADLNRESNKLRNIDLLLSSVNSYTGLMKNRTDYKRMKALVSMIRGEWHQYVDWNPTRFCLQYKPYYSIAARIRRKYSLPARRIHHEKSTEGAPNH